MADRSKIREEVHKLLMELLGQTHQTDKRKKFDYQEFFPVDVKRILKSVLQWQLYPLGDYDARAKSDFINEAIFLNLTGTTPEEMTFSLAHEIGHAVLHPKVVDCYGGSLKRPLSSVQRGIREPQSVQMADLETEADQFAAELLMPPKAIRQHFHKLFNCQSFSTSSPTVQLLTKLGAGAPPYDVASQLAALTPSSGSRSLAEQFGTSRKAMARRLVHLRLVHS